MGRLIKHTGVLLKAKNEKLCVKVLKLMKEMVSVDTGYTGKVCCCLLNFFPCI